MKNHRCVFSFLAALLAAVLLAACASPTTAPAPRPVETEPPVVPAATEPRAATNAPAPTATDTPVPPSITPLPTALPTITRTPTPEVPVPAAVAAYLTGAHVREADPMLTADGWEINDSDVRFEDGLVAHAFRYDRANWVAINHFVSYPAGYAMVVQFKHSPGRYWAPAISESTLGSGWWLGLDLSEYGIYRNIGEAGKSSSQGILSNNYSIANNTWHTLLFAVGKKGRFRIMIIDPERPERYGLWDETRPEWEGGYWQFNFSVGGGTVTLKDFLVIKFEDFVPVDH